MRSVMPKPNQTPQPSGSVLPSESNAFTRSPVSPEEMTRQMEEMQMTQAQILQVMHILQQHMKETNSSPQKLRPTPDYPDRPHDYSLIMRMAFRALKWLFLFLIGFLTAAIVSASLQAKPVVDMLIHLMPALLPPLIVLTLCVMAGAAILESLK
jgi:hypothetical protein